MSQERLGVSNHRPFDRLFQSLSFLTRDIKACISVLTFTLVFKFCTEHGSDTDGLPKISKKTSGNPKQMFWRNGLSWGLNLIQVSDRYPISHKAPVLFIVMGLLNSPTTIHLVSSKITTVAVLAFGILENYHCCRVGIWYPRKLSLLPCWQFHGSGVMQSFEIVG